MPAIALLSKGHLLVQLVLSVFEEKLSTPAFLILMVYALPFPTSKLCFHPAPPASQTDPVTIRAPSGRP